MCKNIVLVSVEEYQKEMSNTNVQPSVQKIDDTSIKVYTKATHKWIPKVQAGQINQGKDEVKDTPTKEEQVVLALVNLSLAETPKKSFKS